MHATMHHLKILCYGLSKFATMAVAIVVAFSAKNANPSQAAAASEGA
jgi:hypothetical protein